MINVLKNNFERIKSKKSVLVIACILMPLLIGIAIFFSVRPATKELIAVSPNVDCLSISNEQYNFVNVEKSPALSELVQGRYVAYNIEFGTAIDFSNVAYILLFTFLLLVFGFMILQKRVQKGDY